MHPLFKTALASAEVPNLRFQTGFGFFVLVPDCTFKNALLWQIVVHSSASYKWILWSVASSGTMLSWSNEHNLKLRKGPSDNQRTLFHCEDNWVLEQAAQGDCGVSVPGGIQKSSGHWPGQTAPSGPAWAGDWTPWPTEVPANLNHTEILWNTMFKDTNFHIFFAQQAETLLTQKRLFLLTIKETSCESRTWWSSAYG